MGTFSRSLALTKQSWSVLKENPQLALFPLISGVVTLIVLASFAVPGFFLISNMHVDQSGNPTGQMQPAYYAFMFAFYLVSYFVVIFFNSGLVTCANEIFAGRPCTFKDGMRNAFSHIGSIFCYAFIAATVGMILKTVAERAGFVGSIIARVLGFGWTLLTYFVAPILVIENKGPVQAIKDSGSMLRKTWGENIIVNTSLHLIFSLIAMVAIIPIGIGVYLLATGAMIIGAMTIVGGIFFILLVSLISSTLTGVFQTALYLYAKTGYLPAVYDPSVVQYAFKPKKGESNYPRY
jgi:hypothetical protein